MKPIYLVVALAVVQSAAFGQFRYRDLNDKSVQLSENGSPVFVFNHGMMLQEGAPADRARCCYLHPVYAPNGAIVTDDFPRDHYHHRGISWMWPVVTVDGKAYDLWTLKGIAARFEKWTRKEAGKDGALLAFQDGWYVGDRKVVEEEVQIAAHPAVQGRRDLDFTLNFRAVVENVSIAGTPEGKKGYGGFNVRFAPRTGTQIETPGQADTPDSDLKPQPWAELSGDFAGKPAGVRVAIDPSNPGSPNGWCLRHYGFLGVEFPGLEAYSLSTSRPLTMKFRVTLIAAASSPAKDHILVYTRNGKGYVHDNIAASVAAIRKMGEEGGFTVDATADPNVFTDATLKQYRALVFSNSNNEAFDSDAQRDAFKRYIQSGGAFVGLHSASGSERNWPYFQAVLGGKFVRHPKMQKFVVRVTDPKNPVTKDLPATFEWTDECYYSDHINPDIRPLLVTDPAKLDDPDKATYPGDRFGDALPLAWYHQYDGGREIYLALGHNKEDYANPVLYGLIRNAILWAIQK